MKKTFKVFAILAAAIFLIPLSANGQKTDCSLSYEKAVLLYNKGMADSTFLTLQPCLESKESMSGIPNETRARMLRLAALSSILMGNSAQAEKYIRQMLTYQPDYKNSPHPDDLEEFRMILEKISAQPSLMIGARAGMNFPLAKVEKKLSDYPTADDTYEISSSIGYQFDIFVEKALSGRLSLKAGAGITRMNFTYTSNGLYDFQFRYTQYIYDQSVTSLEIPVTVRYAFGSKSIRPYVEAGIAGRIMLNSMEKSDAYGRYWFTQSSNSEKILTTFLTDIEYFGIRAGGGVAWEMKNMSLVLDVRYNQSIKNSKVISNFEDADSFDDIPATEKFHYTDDINLVGLNNLQVSFGLIYNLKYKVF